MHSLRTTLCALPAARFIDFAHHACCRWVLSYLYAVYVYRHLLSPAAGLHTEPFAVFCRFCLCTRTPCVCTCILLPTIPHALHTAACVLCGSCMRFMVRFMPRFALSRRVCWFLTTTTDTAHCCYTPYALSATIPVCRSHHALSAALCGSSACTPRSLCRTVYVAVCRARTQQHSLPPACLPFCIATTMHAACFAWMPAVYRTYCLLRTQPPPTLPHLLHHPMPADRVSGYTLPATFPTWCLPCLPVPAHTCLPGSACHMPVPPFTHWSHFLHTHTCLPPLLHCSLHFFTTCHHCLLQSAHRLPAFVFLLLGSLLPACLDLLTTTTHTTVLLTTHACTHHHCLPPAISGLEAVLLHTCAVSGLLY